MNKNHSNVTTGAINTASTPEPSASKESVLEPIEKRETEDLAQSWRGESKTLSVQEVAEFLGVHPVSIYRLLNRNILKAIPCFRTKRIPISQIESLLQGETPKIDPSKKTNKRKSAESRA